MRLIVLKIPSCYHDSEKVFARCTCRSETKGELESFQNRNLLFYVSLSFSLDCLQDFYMHLYFTYSIHIYSIHFYCAYLI